MVYTKTWHVHFLSQRTLGLAPFSAALWLQQKSTKSNPFYVYFQMSQNFVEYFGYLSLLAISAKFGLFFASWISRRFLKSPLDVRKCGGDWALVTGSTDGIGKSYAFALAKKGLNIILVSRSPYKLQNVAAELEQKYSGIKTK